MQSIKESELNKRLQSDSANCHFLYIKPAQKAPVRYAVEAGVIVANQNFEFIKRIHMFHDYFINRVDIDFDKKSVVLGCTFEISDKKGVCEFKDILAVNLNDVMPGSIILDIEEYSVESFVEIERAYFESRLNYGWPAPVRNIEELSRYLKEREYKVWSISASFGLEGFVIAKEVIYRENVG